MVPRSTCHQVSASWRISSTITNLRTECQRPSSRSHSYYASAPNDVWSLGVILVNLTCGRNPWKKASPDDTTFRAFLKDPTFLSSILPLSPELNMILRRIFECDPQRRISLAELRDLILACPRFTMSSYHELPPTPTPTHYYEYVDTADCASMALPPSPPASPPPQSESCRWSLLPASTKQSSGSSTSSSDSGYESENGPCDVYRPQPFNFYGNLIPFPDHEKYYYHHHHQPGVAVY